MNKGGTAGMAGMVPLFLYLQRMHIKLYGDGIKRKETRPRWREAHNVYKACVGTTEANMCTSATSHKPYTAAYMLHLHILHCDGV